MVFLCCVLWFSSVALGASGDSDKKKLVIKKVEGYPSHQIAEGLAIAVQPYTSDQHCNLVFEYKGLVSKGVLPVLIVIENRGSETVQIRGEDIYLTLHEEFERQVRPLELRQVVGKLEKKKKRSIPLPFPRSLGVGGSGNKKLDQLQSRFFDMKLIPPSQNDYGFVYYDLSGKQMLATLKNVYLPEITNVETREQLMFFEISLKTAVEPTPPGGTSLAGNVEPAEVSVDMRSRRMAHSLEDSKSSYGLESPVQQMQRTEPTPPAPLSNNPIVVFKKSEIVISLLSFITTRTAAPGDKFYGQVAIPVVANDQILLPAGSYIVGNVIRTKRAGRLRGKAELELNFNSVIFPTGKTRSIQARGRSADGYKSTDIQASEGTIEANPQKGKDIEQSAKDVLIGASLGSIIIGPTSGNLRGWAAGSIAGAATGLGLTLLRRGNDVELKKGAQITLVLDQDVQLVKPQR